MRAVITKPVSNAYNYSRDKELVGAYSIMGKINGELREVVTARAYMGRSRSASTVYASILVHGATAEQSTSGKGSAGYGYHKESAAFGDAISSACIELYGDVYGPPRYHETENRLLTPAEVRAAVRKKNNRRAHIGGVGDSAMRAAFEAIARAAGARGKLVFVSH